MTIELTYHREGDYLIPDLIPPETPNVGIWGMRRRQFLKKYKDSIYTGMLLNGTLNAHLEKIDKQAEEMLDLLIKQITKKEGISEQEKAENQMAWAAKMNSIQMRAIEIVNYELIYA